MVVVKADGDPEPEISPLDLDMKRQDTKLRRQARPFAE